MSEQREPDRFGESLSYLFFGALIFVALFYGFEFILYLCGADNIWSWLSRQ